MSVKDFIWYTIAAGRGRNADTEVLRRILILNALILPGMLFTLVFGIAAFFKGNYLLGGADAALFIIQLVTLFKTRKTDAIEKPLTFATATVMLFLLFLSAIGGVNNTAILWVFLFPSVSVLLAGIKKGMLYNLCLLTGVILVFSFQHSELIQGEYSQAFQRRFVGVYITIALLAMSAENLWNRICSRLKKSNSEKEEAIKELNKSLEELKTLHGILPICFSCNKIRDDNGYWKALEEYVENKTGARVSHALCPDCAEKLYPEYSTKQSDD